jgi:glycosyltransferase involved in cell wall biosynthesis
MIHESVSLIVPALNEELNLESTIRNIEATVPSFFRDWEILIFNDGSRDNTGRISEQLARENPRILVTHHVTPRNLGACFKEGIQLATKKYLIMIPGDNECATDYMRAVFSATGQADMVIPYTVNQEVRPKMRQWLSAIFAWLVRKTSGVRLRYFNGAVLHKTELLKHLSVDTDGFGYQAEILVKLIRVGHSYKEVAAPIHYRPFGKSKAIRLKSLWAMGGFLLSIFKVRTSLTPSPLGR